MRDIANAKTAASAATSAFDDKTVSIRVSPNSYFIALLLGVFFAAFLIYLEKDFAAAALLALSLIILPALALTDRIAFDGKRLRRTGILPRVWAALNAAPSRLKLTDVEQVETQASRALKRGGNIFYRYRTAVRGRGVTFVFASGGEEYRRMVQQIFPRVTENALDNRSLELRDYLSEPKEVLMKARFEHIPSSEVLEETVNLLEKPARTKRADCSKPPPEIEKLEKADDLRRLANELRLSGYLPQAIEAFRRALLLQPRDGWLLFEAARCLNSFAGSERDRKLFRKSLALLRLAEKRAGDDRELLARLGESYFQLGDWQRARSAFQKSIDRVEENFRSLSGMAQIALREGKIAHVIHNFLAANRLAETPALRRWTQSEADYFSHLNDDEDYMEMEISRINLLETLERSKLTTLKIAVLSFPAILIGVTTDENLIANVGWAVASVSLLIWAGLQMSLGLFADRIPYELVEEVDE